MGRISETIKSLIIANIIFFVATYLIGDVVYRLFSLYYFESPYFHFWQPVSHMFMHGNFMHILFNMYALWAFGTPVEYNLNSRRFLLFFFAAGLGAALIHTGFNFFQIQSISQKIVEAGWSMEDVQRLLHTGGYDTRMLNYITQSDLSNLYGAYNTPVVGGSGAVYGELVDFGMLYPTQDLMIVLL